MSTLVSDLRYGIRVLLKAPGFTLAALATLALGIAANTTMFSVVNGVLLRPLRYPDADRLMTVWQDMRARGGPADEWTSPRTFLDWRAGHGGVFTALTAVSDGNANITGSDAPERLRGALVTHDFFRVAGVMPALGRGFTAEEDLPTGERVAVLSHGLWVRRFGSDRGIIGRRIVLDDTSHTIVGVMPAGFRSIVVDDAEIWRPLRIDQATATRGAIVLRVVGRLAPTVTVDHASAAMSSLMLRLTESARELREVTTSIVPLHEYVVGDVRTPLIVLLGAVGFVLLTACANVANLLLTRASARQRELAVRVALGAARGRLVRQLLTESVLLALGGGAIGLLLATWCTDLVIRFSPPGAPRLDDIAIDWRVLLFTAALTIGTGIVFGLAPALRLSRDDVSAPLKEGGRGATAGGRRLRDALVIAELAVSLLLLVGASLLIRSFLRLQQVNPGFVAENVLVGDVVLPSGNYPEDAHVVQFFSRLLERLRALPSVESASATALIPLGGGNSDRSFLVEGRPAPSTPGETPVAWYREVTSGYFETLRIPIVRGRAFTDADREGAEPVVIVNQTMAKRFWPDEDPIGRRIRMETNGPWVSIVGVAKDIRHRALDRTPDVEMFLPFAQSPNRVMTVALRTSGDPDALAGALRSEVQALDRSLPVALIGPLEDLVSDSVAAPRFYTALLSVFAAMTLMLAAVGIYGVIAYAVSQRASEIGLRIALGAQRSDVVRLILGRGLLLVGIGVAGGIGSSLLLTRAMSTLLFEVSATDPASYAITAALLIVTALAASYVPARRALAVDPVVALRTE